MLPRGFPSSHWRCKQDSTRPVCACESRFERSFPDPPHREFTREIQQRPPFKAGFTKRFFSLHQQTHSGPFYPLRGHQSSARCSDLLRSAFAPRKHQVALISHLASGAQFVRRKHNEQGHIEGERRSAPQRFGVPVDQLAVSDAVISVKADPSRRVTYGDLIGGKRFNVTLTANTWTQPLAPQD